MNTVSFFGAVDSEPRLLGMPGRDVCEFWLAVEGFKRSQTLHIRVIAFRERAVQLAARLAEGDLVALSGRLRSEADPDRPRTYTYSVIVAELCRASEFERREQETPR